MRNVTYKDRRGRLFNVNVPDGAKEEDYRHGIVVGPPDLSDLGLPSTFEVRLNNELFHRGILTYMDAKKRRTDVVAALQAVLKVDADKVLMQYQNIEKGEL